MRRRFPGAVSILLVASAAFAADPPADAPTAEPLKIAVSSFHGVELKPELVAFFTEHFAQALTEAGVKVTTPAQINSLLGLERQKQLTGCGGESETSTCMTELANALGVDAIAIGEIAKLGDTYRVNLKISSAEKGEILVSASAKAANESEVADQLTKSADQMAPIAAKKLNKPLKAVSRKQTNNAFANAPPPREVKEVLPARHWPVAVVIVGGLAAGVGALFLVSGSGYHSSLTDKGQSGYDVTFNEAKHDNYYGKLDVYWGWPLLLGGTAAAVGGVILYRGSEQIIYASAAPYSSGGMVAISGVLP